MANQVLISERFRAYVHKVPYAWAGASPRGWDCSGAVNYVTCHDIGYDIPDFKGHHFTGNIHGPSTYGWLGWGGIAEIPRSKCTHGTIVIWPSHMGIATGPHYYISAYDTALGTVEEPIHGGGPIGETARFFDLRQRGSPPGSGGGGVGGKIPGGRSDAGKEWVSMQDNWNQLRHTLGPFSKSANRQVDAVTYRMRRIKKT